MSKDTKNNFSEINYYQILERMGEAFATCRIIYDSSRKAVDARYLYVNPAFARVTGVEKNRVIGHTVKDIYPKIEQQWFETYDRVVQKGKPESFEEVNGLDGKTFSLNVWRSDNECFSIIFEDITKKKKELAIIDKKNASLGKLLQLQKKTAQKMSNIIKELAISKDLIEIEKKKNEAIISSIGDGVIAISTDCKIMLVNSSAEAILGYTKKELIGKELTHLPIVNEDGSLIPLEKRPTTIILSTGKPVKMIAFFLKKNKKRIPISIMGTPIMLNEKIVGVVEIIRDITNEKEIDRAKSEFVSLASHQLRTPLGISKWYLEAIKDEDYLKNIPDIAKIYMDEIYKSNERLLSLVRELLSISRIDQGKVTDATQLINIPELVTTVIKDMHLFAEKSNISVQLHLKKQKFEPMRIDPLRLREMLENLITNAILYSKPHKKVTISLDKLDEKIIFCVTDTGIGISERDKKHLFTKFYRSEKATIKNANGSGLGLYVVKSYVDGWGGTISVKSSEGKGTSFTIKLPFIIKRLDKLT